MPNGRLSTFVLPHANCELFRASTEVPRMPGSRGIQ
jgi:hypothetical protein